MRPVDISEIKNIAEYELARPEWRPKIMALKDRRRIRVGEHMTFLFENHDTVLYQIQEMMRVERMVRAGEIANEVSTYNELIPGPRELSASLLIEYEDATERDRRLGELVGLERHIWFEVEGARSPSQCDDRQMSRDRLSAVQYVKFRLTDEQVTAFPQNARLVIEHPQYRADHVLTAEERAELARDFD